MIGILATFFINCIFKWVYGATKESRQHSIATPRCTWNAPTSSQMGMLFGWRR